jgi:hypothetical protein
MIQEIIMLTEADMIRIMAEKYSMTESLADAYIDNEARKLLDIDELFEMQDEELFDKQDYDYLLTEVND